jgi:hypothetical protein
MGRKARAAARPERRTPSTGQRETARPAAARRVAPARPSPDPLRSLARAERLGHRLQRYTQLAADSFPKAGTELFPSQQLDRSRSAQIPFSHRLITQNLKWVERYAANPPLDVSRAGRLAIESTAGQPKVFFGLPDVVRASAQKLEDLESRITLATETTRTVTVPRDPANPGPESHTLVQVRPEPNRQVNPTGPLMSAHECDSVSQEIVSGKNVIVGNTAEGFERTASVSVRGGEIADVARAAGRFGVGDRIADFANMRRQAEGERRSVWDSSIPITPRVRDYFAPGWLRRAHLVPETQVLRALSLPGVPDEALKQVYELHVRKAESQRPDRWSLLSYVESVLRFQDVREYQRHRGDAALDRRLGLNEEAAPEVGESFSTIAQRSPPAVDEHGVLSHEVDVSRLSHAEAGGVLRDLLRLRASAQQLGTLAADQYRRARGVVPFQEHHAAVVARDGPDAVTFENYNRGAEQSALWGDLWDDLLAEFPRFDRNVKDEVRDVRDGIERAQRDPSLDPFTKISRVGRLKEAHIELLRQKFLTVAAYTGLKIDTNLGEMPGERWFFAMYGPGGQSFHARWSGAVPNAVTVRTSGEVDAYRRRKTAELRGRVAAVAYRTALAEDVENGRLLYDALTSSLFAELEAAATRPRAAEAYRALLERLDDLETELGPEDEDDGLVVEALVAGSPGAVQTAMVRLRQRRRQAEERRVFNRSQALALHPTHPALVLKYGRWSLDDQRRRDGLDRRIALLRQLQ